jgi:transglutaminase-like putative cysteine protease
MILTVNHVTAYSYDRPVRAAVQSLRLTPSRCDGQRTIRWDVQVEGGARGERIAVRVEGSVETFDTAGILRGHREQVPPIAYLRDTTATRADRAVADLAHATASQANGALDTAHRLSAAVAEAIAYVPGATSHATTAAEALAQGEGVCQDHAQVLVAMARATGLPARYVSGYLFADADGRPHEAAHAWAEVWIDGLGWIGFDPTNGCCPDERYIRLGSGYDARDAAPVRGVAHGAATERLDVEVAISAAQQ